MSLGGRSRVPRRRTRSRIPRREFDCFICSSLMFMLLQSQNPASRHSPPSSTPPSPALSQAPPYRAPEGAKDRVRHPHRQACCREKGKGCRYQGWTQGYIIMGLVPFWWSGEVIVRGTTCRIRSPFFFVVCFFHPPAA